MTDRTPFEAAAAEMRADIEAADRAAQTRPHDHVLTLAELYQGAEPGDVLDQAAAAAEAALAAPRNFQLRREVQEALNGVRREPSLQGLRRLACACDAFAQDDAQGPLARMAYRQWRDHAAVLLMIAGDRVGARMVVRKAFALLVAGSHSSLVHYELWVTLVEALHVSTDGRGEDEPGDYGPVPRMPSRLIARQRLSMQTEVVLLHEHATAAIVEGFAEDLPHDPDFDFMDLERPGPLRRRPLRPAPRPVRKAAPAAPATPAPAGGPARRPLVSGSLDHLTGVMAPYKKLAKAPLPSVAVGDLAEIRDGLVEETPWAAAEIARMLAPLAGRERVVLPGHLLVGAQGSGKSEFAVGLLERLGLTVSVYPAGGTSDGASFGGTSRMYHTARLSVPGQLMLSAGSATVGLVIDEGDKIGASDLNGLLTAALLAVTEPSRRHAYRDPGLDAETDLSGLSLIVTANRAEPLRGPLLDRLTVVPWPSPRRQDLLVVARGIVRALRREAGTDAVWLPDLDASEIKALQGWQGGSMRPLRRAVERLVALRADPRLAN
jgi:ATP-dependent Lon protease